MTMFSGGRRLGLGSQVVFLRRGMWWWVRWVLLALLVLSFATVLLRLVPISGSTSSLVSDIRSGRVHTVQIDAEGTEATVRWSTGLLMERGYVYHSASFVPGAQETADDFVSTVRREAGIAAYQVQFKTFDSTFGGGGVGMLLPIVYFLLTPWLWLRVMAFIVGAVVLARALSIRQHRVASGPAWVLVCLLSGVGFFAYLWAEPGSSQAEAAVAGRPLHWRRAWLASLMSAAGLCMVGGLVLLVGGRL